MNRLSLLDGVLSLGSEPLLEGLDSAFSLKGSFLSLPREPDRNGTGPWRHAALGRPARVTAFAGQEQRSPFWFTPVQGTDPAALDGAAAWMLLKRDDGLFVLLVPLPAGNASSHLVGTAPGGALRLYRSTGNPALAPTGGRVLHVAAGRDPGALLASSARAVARALPAAALRKDKADPPFEDLLGWCTWNAFYQDVTAKKFLDGLARHRALGVRLGFAILDDGWQRETPPTPVSRRYLAGFGTDQAKFPDGLGPVARKARETFGLRHVLAWLDPQGLPAGVDPAAFKRYRPTLATPQPDAHVALEPVFSWFDSHLLRFPGDWLAFLRDRFAELREAGVDGVKVDYQGTLFFGAARSHAASRPGECARMRNALETAATEAFGDQWLSCMAHLPEFWYHARRNNLSRGSDDFYPGIPASHGSHIRANAFTGLWFGHFMGVDWDMFQSKHPFGAYHAAARALSGGPVYTADEPDGIDPELLRRVAFADGRVPRFPNPATPSLRSLFPEPGDDPRAFVVVNSGTSSGAAGLFDVGTAEPARPVRATVTAEEVFGRDHTLFRFCRVRTFLLWTDDGTVRFVRRDEPVVLETGPDRFRIASFLPFRSSGACGDLGFDGTFAAIGFPSLLVPSAAVVCAGPGRDHDGVKLAGPGRFAAWIADRPIHVFLGDGGGDQEALPFEYDPETHLIFVDVPEVPDGRPELSFTHPPHRNP